MQFKIQVSWKSRADQLALSFQSPCLFAYKEFFFHEATHPERSWLCYLYTSIRTKYKTPMLSKELFLVFLAGG